MVFARLEICIHVCKGTYSHYTFDCVLEQLDNTIEPGNIYSSHPKSDKVSFARPPVMSDDVY